MNNDILYEVIKYYTDSKQNICNDSFLIARNNIKIRGQFLYFIKNKKIKRPIFNSNKNEKEIELLKTNTEKINSTINNILKTKNDVHKNFISPLISNLVKKMDFEYKKILIIYKLGLSRTKV